MGASPSRQLKTRREIQDELLDDLHQKRLALKQARDQDRDAARQRFMDALELYKSTVIHLVKDMTDKQRRLLRQKFRE
jgi:ABC-type transporter MlaC component